MKKIALLFTILIYQLSFSQSTVRKYNSFKNQYEYYNSNGDMIVYEKYNAFQKQWEYYTVETEYNSTYDELKYEGIDISNIASTLSFLQKKNDTNTKYVQRQIDILTGEVLKSKLTAGQKVKIIDRFLEGPLKNVNKLKIDYSSSNSTNQVVEYLYDSMANIIEDVLSDPINSSDYLKNYYNKELKVYKITIYENNELRNDVILTDSYVIFKNDEVVFKKANGEIRYRNLMNKKYNSYKGGYEYNSNWGALFVDENLNYVEFFFSSNPNGNNYTYYISK